MWPKSSRLEYHALTSANVVIYDRTLAGSVAEVLPLGAYAEPAGSSDYEEEAFETAPWERVLRFVRDGWSVARIARPGLLSGRQGVSTLRQLARRLSSLNMANGPAVSVFANRGGGVYEETATWLTDLDEIAAGECSGQSRTFTMIFDGLDIGSGPHFSSASANGPAG